MQKKKGVPQKKKAAVYSPEALLLRTLAGVLLIALGILSLVSVVAPMDGQIFILMQKLTRPVGGELCLLFPVFLTWAGILVAFSSRRKMPARALVLSFLIYWFMLGVITLVTFVWDATDKTYYGVIEYVSRVNARTVPLSTGFLPDMMRVYELQLRTIEAGGMLGAILAWPLYTFLGTAVSVTILVLSDLGLLILLSRVDLKALTANFKERSQQRGDRRAQEMAERQVQEEAYRREQAQRQAATQAQAQAAPIPAYQRRSMTPAPVPASGPSWRSGGGELYDETIIPGEAEAAMDVAGSIKRAQGRKKPEPIPMPREDDLPWEDDPDTARELDSRRSILKPIRFPTPKPAPASTPDFPAVKSPNIPPAPRMSGQRLDEPDLDLPPQKTKKTQQLQMKLPPPYAYPTLEMLKSPKRAQVDTRQEDEQRAAILEETLMSFGISAQVRQVTHGPTVTRFELELASGINVKRITSLTDTIAMNLAAGGVRIEAPIPNKALVGVEVPNREITPVTLREVLESQEMGRADDAPLSVALGKDIAGSPIICDLSKMPHLLIAGATGSGKSVCINSIICSLLFRTSPKQVRLLLIDPKVVELQCYNGIPHLLTPVVSDPHKASGALTWAVTEMMERYQKFKERNVRGITGYNAALQEGEEAMPRIVVIIDELADLMMASKREVEESICRIAQLARAAGIHLVVATQRPSVDVITGLIKNNLPSRIAFAVASSIDARTIMERAGAEKLLGKGDMLYAPAGALAPMRVQGSFVSDDEVNRVTDFIRSHSAPEYDPNIQELLDQTTSSSAMAPDAADPTGEDEGLDELLSQAIEMAVQEGQTSISMLQRKMRIGYARAGRLIDEMTKRGIISQAAGAKPRKVLISREEFDQMDFEE